MEHKNTKKSHKKSKNPKATSSGHDESSTEARVIKKRIHTLTGSDDIRINDPYYRDRLREKLRQEYEIQQDKAEKEREEAERERMRRLVTRGIIGADALRNDPILSREYRLSHELNGTKRKNKKRPRNRKPSPQRVKSAPQLHRDNKRVNSSISPVRRSRMSNRRSHEYNNSYLHPNASFRSHSPDSSRLFYRRAPDSISLYSDISMSFSADESLASRSRRPMTSVARRPQTHSVTSSNSDRVSIDDRPISRSSTKSRHENIVIRQMREEETLEGLYRLAEEIIPESEKQQKKPERDKTEEELALEEENKYKNKKIVVKVKF